MLDAGDVACVEVRLADADAGEWRAAAEALRPVAQDRGVAILLADQPAIARASGCDGVVVGPAAGTYHRARQVVGDQAIVGVLCAASRHDAMTAAEAGADFVGLSPEPELIAWWAEMMEPPCVAFAEGGPATACVEAGADFLAVGGTVWGDPDGPVSGLKRAHAIATRHR